MSYQEWIDQYAVDQKHQLLGKCRQASLAMQQAFPELRTVRGHVETNWGRRAHWWLVDAEDNIVDPTVLQFDVIFSYDPWEPGDEVCVGKCMECGEHIWKSTDNLDNVRKETFCSEDCCTSFTVALGHV